MENNSSNSAYIGHGTGGNHDKNGTLNLGDNLCIWREGSPYVAASERVSTCRLDTRDIWLKIAVCGHPDKTFTITAETHTLNCPNCLDYTTHNHEKDPADNRCTVCGYEISMYWISFSKGDDAASGNMDPVAIVPGSVYILPDCSFEAPEGKRFRAWAIDTGSTVVSPFAEGDEFTVYGDITVTALWMSSGPFGTPDLVLPADLNAIEANAFEGSAATVVGIPEGCTFIDDYAFRNCRNLTQIRIPADCELGADVFDGCGLVIVYSTPGSFAETYCNAHINCVFATTE